MAKPLDVIVVTGALGNTGWKLVCHLAGHSGAERLVGIDIEPPNREHHETLERLASERPDPGPLVEFREADLTDWGDARWRDGVAEARALVKAAQAHGVPVVFLFWPRIEFMMEPGSTHPYTEHLEGVANGSTVKLLDLAEAFREKGGEALYLDGIHATVEGHRVAAECLVQTLKELGVSPKR